MVDVILSRKDLNFLINLIKSQIRVNNILLRLMDSDLELDNFDIDIKEFEKDYKKLSLETSKLKNLLIILKSS